MGGFILFRDVNENEENKALSVFSRKKLVPNSQLRFDGFKLVTFGKQSVQNNNLHSFNSSDFVASVGTSLYKNMVGKTAAQLIYDDLRNNNELNFADFKGHFCFIIKVSDTLAIFNDYNGLYHVYYDTEKRVFSNSFLAISTLINNKELAVQELYEYIFQEATYGGNTILMNISQLNCKSIYYLRPQILELRKRYIKKFNLENLDFKVEVNNTVAQINNYFSSILSNFNSISLGLSGGFDSRLILMCLLNNNKKPHVYTSGTKDSFDVNFARGVCNKYGLEFTHFDIEKSENYSPDEYLELISERFYYTDGFSYNGIFSKLLRSMDVETSLKAELNFNGAGGEIYQSFWKLNQRKLDIGKFVESRYLNFDLSIPTKKFNRSNFIHELSRKNLESLDIPNSKSKLSENLIELLYPNFRLRYWFGKSTSKMNQLCYALVPFSEPYFYLNSYRLPVKFKVGGKFESALLKTINPVIAKFDSQYGFNFYDGPNHKHIISDWIKILTPIKLRPLIRSLKSRNDAGLSKLKNESKILFQEPFLIDEYINRDKITNVEMYSRVLTVEYYLKNFM